MLDDLTEKIYIIKHRTTTSNRYIVPIYSYQISLSSSLISYSVVQIMYISRFSCMFT